MLCAGGGGSGVFELLDDGEHIMVRIDAVRRLAESRVGPDWEADFAGMLAYAQRKGWVSEDGSGVLVAERRRGMPGDSPLVVGDVITSGECTQGTEECALSLYSNEKLRAKC